MQSFTGPFDGPPVRTSFANYTDTLRKYEAMAYREQSGSGGTLDGGQLQLSGLPGTHSVTRIELPAEASLGTHEQYLIAISTFAPDSIPK